MFTAHPMPFQEAFDAARVRSLLPTTGVTADLQRLEPAIRRRALFSATVDSGARLQRLGDAVDELLAGETDQATVRLRLRQALDAEGYRPDPEQIDGLRDLASEARINLQLETNVATAQGYGNYLQGTQDAVLDEWPAQELIRIFDPNGARRDWAARWVRAGGQFHGGRMIALKSDPIWQRLGDSAIFPDGLGNPYPPFAFNSGMDVQDITRREAVSLGLIDPLATAKPVEPVDFNAELRASPAIRAEWLREAVVDQGVGRWVGEVFVFDQGGAL